MRGSSWNMDLDFARARLASSVAGHALGVESEEILGALRGSSEVAFARLSRCISAMSLSN